MSNMEQHSVVHDHESSVLELRDVCLDGIDKRVLSSVSLRIDAQKMFLIAGPSGAGKTSLLRLLNLLTLPTSGEVLYRGVDACTYDPPVLRSEVVMLTQEPVMFPGTVMENLMIPVTYASNRDKRTDTSDAERFLAELGLGRELMKQDVSRLSGGEKQRVALARALMVRPKVLLADEPTSALDPVSEDKVISMFSRLSDEITVVVASHSLRLLRMADRVILLSNGELVETLDTIDEIRFREFLHIEEKKKDG